MKKIKKIGYSLSFLIAFVLLIIGVIIELFSSHNGITMPKWPINIVILGIVVVYIIVLNYFWKSDLKKWFSSIKSTIGAISAYAILVLIMGFVAQDDLASNVLIKNLGFSHINKSWPFLLISAYLLTILGFVILKRLKKILKFRNFAFFLNHFGIWLVIATASVGSSDLQRLTLPLYENQISSYAIKDDSTLVQLPFTVELNDFYIKNFNPNVIVFNPNTREILNEPGINYSADSLNSFTYNNWTVEIVETLPKSVFNGSEFVFKDTTTSQFSAFVKISDGNETNKVWISSGNYIDASAVSILENNLAISLSLPAEKKYVSEISIFNDNVKIDSLKIEVNKPYKYMGYKIYQQGFDNANGQDITILEVVKDPWLPVVYIGLIMLTIGSTMLLWLGKKR